MTFYILANKIVSLFLSMNLLTTLSFESEVISYYYGGDKGDLFIELTNNQRTLAIKAKKENLASNMLVITRAGKFYFTLKVDDKSPHQFIEVKQGQINQAMKLFKTYPSFEIWEGSTSLMILNKGKNELEVNGMKIKDKEYFSKGPPLMISGERLF